VVRCQERKNKKDNLPRLSFFKFFPHLFSNHKKASIPVFFGILLIVETKVLKQPKFVQPVSTLPRPLGI
jgi:hypothetical protein